MYAREHMGSAYWSLTSEHSLDAIPKKKQLETFVTKV